MQKEKTIHVCDYCENETNIQCLVCWKDVCYSHLWKKWIPDFRRYEDYYDAIICYKCSHKVWETEIINMQKTIKHESLKLCKQLEDETLKKRIKERSNYKFDRKDFIHNLFKTITNL